MLSQKPRRLLTLQPCLPVIVNMPTNNQLLDATANHVFGFRWFHGSITRDEAETLLQPREDGLFLVRESTNFPGDYTLCVCFQGKVEHYRVKYLDNKLTIDDEEYFENLGQLVAVSTFKLRSYSRDLITVLFAALRKRCGRFVYAIAQMLTETR